MIILDDGADLLRATPGLFFNSIHSIGVKNRPDMIVGIEQTRGGSNRPTFNGLPFPIINVAGSYAKTEIEYPHVANLVAKKLLKVIQTEITPEIKRKPLIGVIGFGTMGQAVTTKMLECGFEVIVFDKDRSRFNSDSQIIHYDNSAILIANADIIIGCTGKDITQKKSNLSAFLYSRQKKWLISTSSKDREFNTLLRVIQSEIKGLGYAPDPFRTIHYENHATGVIDILRGGFPINFDNEAHSVPPECIWPTRSALLLACLSAVQMQKNYQKNFSLDINTFMFSPQAQLLIMKKYFELNPNDISLITLAEMSENMLLNHIIQHSEGTFANSLK
jgi:3-hydroxyisobutyrate dehydrogenase and related beta-hydroxyacid dehydrogenases